MPLVVSGLYSQTKEGNMSGEDKKAILANKFCEAFYKRKWIGELKPPVSALSIEDAYGVQDLVTRMRIDKGETVAGFKVGCTSRAIRSQFGLKEPINGRIFRPHVHKQGVELNWKDYGSCAIEPEMVIKISRDLRGEGMSDDRLIEAIEWVSPGIEIHNFRFWFEPATSQELICSGGIHTGLVVGDAKVSPKELSFENELFSVFKDGMPVTKGPASEIMGGPLNSLRWLVGFLTRKGRWLKKGSLVIPGSPVELVNIDCDTKLGVKIERVGALVTNFREKKIVT